ncbi:retrovirus-related pol polyprotein from transposon TNT 1-94 [Tanacetum coccineum]
MVLEKKVNTTPVDYAVLNQLSQDFEKQFVPQTELSAEQAFWSQNSMNSTDPNPSCRPTKVKVPKELLKISMVNTSLKKLKHHLAGFDVVVKERTTTTAITEGSWGFEHTKACFRDEIIPFVKALKDLFNTFDQYLIDELSKVQNVFHQMEQAVEQHPQSQEKDRVIKKLKERIKSLIGNMNEDKVKKDIEEIETINIELDHKVSKLIAENEHLKQTYKQLYDSIKPTRKDLADNVVIKHTIAPKMFKTDVEPIAPRLLNNRIAHSDYLRHTQEQATILREIVEQGQKRVKPSTNASGSQPSSNTKKDKIQRTPSSTQKNKVEAHPRTCNGFMLSDNHDLCVLDFINDVNVRVKPKSVKKIGNVCPLIRITITAEVPLRKPTALESDTPKPIVTLVYSRKLRKSKTNVLVSKNKIIKSISANKKEPIKFKNDHAAKILGYADYQIGNVMISRVYYVEGLGHNLFFIGQFYDSNLEVSFRQHTCFIRNLEGADLFIGSRGNNLYTLSLGDMMASSPIYLLHALVRGLPKLKFEKDHLCSACAMGKSKKKPHKPKSEDTNQEKLYLLHMDLCGPMHVASVNGKKYILVIVNDYSRFTWVKCLRTDNGTKFVNQTLIEYYEKVGISHETSVARSPQQNGVVEIRNRTLIEAAHTMLIYAKAPLFLWAEAVATASMTSEHNSLEPALHEMTPATISSGLVPNPPPLTLFVPPSRTNWDLLFQPLFDELLNPPSSVDHPALEVIAPIAEVVTPDAAASTSSPSSTTVDQNIPSLGNSQTTHETKSLVISNDVIEENHDLDVAHMNNDPFFGILIPENNSKASSSSDVRIKQKSQENGQNRTNTDTGTEEHAKSQEKAIKSQKWSTQVNLLST